jgi:hypothetical protein
VKNLKSVKKRSRKTGKKGKNNPQKSHLPELTSVDIFAYFLSVSYLFMYLQQIISMYNCTIFLFYSISYQRHFLKPVKALTLFLTIA